MNIAVILAGGTGSRLGADIPKQYIEIHGKSIIEYCLERFAVCDIVDAIHIVADAGWHGYIENRMGGALSEKWRGFSEPGTNRQLSIYNALTDIYWYASFNDYVMIHDAARPQVSPEFIRQCFERARENDGILPVLSMKDTVYLSGDGKSVCSLLNREKVYAGQTPEVFHFGKYYEANRALLPDRILKISGSTEPAIIAGMDIAMLPGDEGNFKITTKTDLERFGQIIAHGEGI